MEEGRLGIESIGIAFSEHNLHHVYVPRQITDVLHFRNDISPFLVHLTKFQNKIGPAAKETLKKIIGESRLVAGAALVSDANRAMHQRQIQQEGIEKYFSAICFTETPISEIHCLLEIDKRHVDLEPYGLVFVKEKMIAKGVSPVLYINNSLSDQDDVAVALCSLIKTSPAAAEKILPLIGVFGKGFLGPWAKSPNRVDVDFSWEREWRYPALKGPLSYEAADVFVGLCPHEEISEFEALFPGVAFIDPRRNMKWYATQLIAARQRLSLKNSVV